MRSSSGPRRGHSRRDGRGARRIASRYCLEGFTEGRGVLGLDSRDDVVHVGVRIDLARGRASGPLVSSASFCSPSARMASASSPSNARSATSRSCSSRPTTGCIDPVGEGVLEPVSYRGPPRRDAAEAARSSRRCSAGPSTPRPAASELVEERGQLPGRLDLDALPEPDLREARRDDAPPRGASARLRGDRRSRPAARRAGRGRARTAGTGRRRPCRAPAIGAPRCAARRPRRSRGGRCAAPGRARSGPGRRGRPVVEGLDGGEVLAVGRDLARGSSRARRRRADRRRRGCRSTSPRSGSSRRSRRNRASTRS